MMHLVIEDPSPCEDCEGSRTLPLYEYDQLGVLQVIARRPCSACCCEVCGQPTDTPTLCKDCAQKEEPCPTPNPTPAGPTANQRTLDVPTSTFPTRADGETRQPDAEWDLAERAYERGQDR